ncbi:cupin domain-containing protein [Candidatus Nitrospira salsa]|nr:MAG: cupin [Nitrospirales bacterium]
MVDSTIKKVCADHAPKGKMGQKYLVTGKNLSMRLWEHEASGESKPPTARQYETVGYVIKGRAELQIEGQMMILDPGDSWLIPKGASHSFTILEDFTAIEATYPPAHIHSRDEQ